MDEEGKDEFLAGEGEEREVRDNVELVVLIGPVTELSRRFVNGVWIVNDWTDFD